MHTETETHKVGAVSLAPRTVVRFEQGGRRQIQAVKPTPFGPCRADQIWSERIDFQSFPYQACTDGELAYIHAVWEAMENRGPTTFSTAFGKIAQGKVPA
jgi:hypothetical protein